MSACRSCGAPVIWAKTAAGKLMPLDAVSLSIDTPGAFVIKQGEAIAVDRAVEMYAADKAVSIAHARQWLDEDRGAHLSHFATCPNASSHRR